MSRSEAAAKSAKNRPVDSRRVALQALGHSRQGRRLPEALELGGIAELNERDRAFCRRLVQHAVRHRRRLESQMAVYLKRPKADALVLDLIWLGAAQIDLDDVADHAAVNSTVNVAPKRLRGLINALLRRRLREPPAAIDDPRVQESWPNWLFRRLSSDWGEQAPALRQALNQEPTLCLRVNRQKVSRETYQKQLGELGIESKAVAGSGLLLGKSVSVGDLPGYADGHVSVQGQAAQWAVELLDLEPGLKVLDACAAPGGKTTGLLEREPAIECVAVDSDAQRMERLSDNLQRLGFHAQVRAADLLQSGDWEQDYDRILLDAPCSGTGVIGKHPDIKWLRRAQDVRELQGIQAQLLRRLWALLKPGGQLLYCTCSVLSAENDEIVAAFVQETADAQIDSLNLPLGQVSEYGWRIPAQSDSEGFYFARLIKAHEPA